MRDLDGRRVSFFTLVDLEARVRRDHALRAIRRFTDTAGGGSHDAVKFGWDGNDEMDEACGSGWAQLQADGSLKGEICSRGGDDIAFIPRRWAASSTPC